MDLGELNAVESQLWRSFARGGVVDVHDGLSAAERAVRAEVVAALLLGAGADPAPGDRPALRLTGACIAGKLDLRFADIAVPIVLGPVAEVHCWAVESYGSLQSRAC
ncbi:hypothetical protein ACFY7V_31585 [[Kitasatospora] papulosa]|uniref:Uncharacterized protein n=1 Tax=[Kitasatospora] papulosa TaxID=1464011 RepID=A0ABZ1JWV8_9ACTN|nr:MULTISPECIES: hypothetical protein [unclassified Streptomyces]